MDFTNMQTQSADICDSQYPPSSMTVKTFNSNEDISSSKVTNITYEDYLSKLCPLLEQHTPTGSNHKAVLDQWLHAIQYDKELYCNQSVCNHDELKQQVIKTLKKFKFPTPSINKKAGKFTFIDLFAGIGGIRTGAERNQGMCVFSSEFDKFAQQTYKLNYGEMPFGDITNIDAHNVPNHDLLLAGFPCQPFSYSGRTEGFEDKTRGTLFFDVLRILEAKKPKYALLENVKGFKSHDKGKTMEIALNALNEAGYNTYWRILNSYDYGVPQFRERWYCVAIRKDIDNGQFSFPNKEDRGTTIRDIIDMENDDKSLKLSDFEIARIKYHFDNCHLNERVEHDNSMYAPHTKKGKHGVFSYLKSDGALRFHVGDFAKTQIQEAFYASLDTYSPTIIANRVPKLWDLQRKLSVQEALRLQGFSDNFKFDVSNAQAYKQLGNSVTVPVIEAVLEQLFQSQK